MRRKIKRPSTSLRRFEPLEQRSLLTTLVALIDTGVDLSSTADLPYYDLAAGYNAYTQQTTAQGGTGVVQDNNHPPDGSTGHYHGSAVADNIVAGIQDAQAQPGAAGANVQILPIRMTTNSGSVDNNAIIRGIYYAVDHGASVVNLSIDASTNFSDTNATDPYYGKTLSDAIAYAGSKNDVVVTGPGNNGVNIDSPTNPVAIYPADIHSANMLVVAAVDPTGNLSSVSNWGSTHVDLGALPAGNVPETSYSTGIASGIVGVLEALTPQWSAPKMVQYVETTAWPSPGLAGKTTSGGVINPTNAVHGIVGSLGTFAIDAGGSTSGLFLADTDVSGGGTSSVSTPIDTAGVINPAPQGVYQTSRYGNFAYTIPNLTPGLSYTVRLHFAETFYTGPAQRLFDVSINHQPVLTNFDVFAVAGGMDKALVEQFKATADASGHIVLAFSNNAILSGFEIIPPTVATSDPLPVPVAVSLGQDGSDLAGLTATPAPDGFQDVHISLSHLDANLAIDRVVVNRLGGGGLYRSDGSYASWSTVLVRPGSAGQYATAADLYFQPSRNDTNYPYQIDVYYKGSAVPISTFVNVSAISALPDHPQPTAVSLGQDGSDVAQLASTGGSDGLQDVHILLGNLITSLPIARVEVDQLGGGGLYRSDGSYASWSTVVVRDGGAGSYASTADLYFQPNQNETAYPYQINVYYQGVKSPFSTFVLVTANAHLADLTTPVATSLGQDGSDLAQLAPTAGSDGYQDVHVRITGLAAGATIDRIAVRRDGGGGDYLSTGSYGTWMAVTVRPATAQAIDASIADLYFQPAQDNVDRLFWIDIYENGQKTPTTIPVTLSDKGQLADGVG